MKNKKATFNLWEVIFIVLIGSLIMSISTGYIVYQNKDTTDYTKLTSSKHIGEFLNSYNSIVENYYDNINEPALIDAAISGMLEYLGDPYTTHLNDVSTNMLQDSLQGTYKGIGVEVKVDENQKLVVKNVFEDSPAKKSNILSGDIIIAINEVNVEGKSAQEAVTIIQDAQNDNIKLTILRDNQEIIAELVKENLFIPAVSSKIYENNNQKVGYIYIKKFSQSIYEQFKIELNKLEKDNINNLVIDLRNNTGGYLSAAADIAQLFLEKGKIIYSLEKKLQTVHTKDTTEESRNYKVGVLVNQNSASASEVLAAALKYSYNSPIIGMKTYGKGKVQETSKLANGSMMKYTSAKWLTPNGDCIDEIGLIPDIVVELSEEYDQNPIEENDNQLKTAINEISKAS